MGAGGDPKRLSRLVEGSAVFFLLYVTYLVD